MLVKLFTVAMVIVYWVLVVAVQPLAESGPPERYHQGTHPDLPRHQEVLWFADP
jgi:hypothetical protein